MTDCPDCPPGTPGLAKYSGHCSRGCLSKHRRQHRKPLVFKVPWPKPEPMAGPVAKPVGYFVMQSPPPPCDDMIRCDICQTKSPDWATFDIVGVKVCCSCRPAYLARKRERDDRATMSPPFAGGGVRVVRKTGGLT